MTNLRSALNRFALIRKLASINIAVVCLSLLFILTFWGTIAQIHQGLYAAQERFFYSWYFLAAGFIPFPGAQLVLWVLFINLLCVSLTRFVYRWSHIGIVIIHAGLLTYFVAAFVTFHLTKESNVTFYEGEGTNVSAAYDAWELAVWPQEQSSDGHALRQVTAYDLKSSMMGQELDFKAYHFQVLVKQFYPNARAYAKSDADPAAPKKIESLTAMPLELEREKNLAGGVFEIKHGKGDAGRLILYSGMMRPTWVTIQGKPYAFILRHKRWTLPFTIILKDFDMDMHPGTEVASRYQSLVTLSHDGLTRDVLIYMNNPLRYQDYTFYQASYAIDAMGRQRSTLAVVKNAGRLLPYIASLLTFFGLAFHFLMMGWRRGKVR